MATQTQTQEVVEREQPRHRRRAKERPDALVNQFSNISETNSSTQQQNTESKAVVSNTQVNSTLQEAAQAFLKMDSAICVYLVEASRRLDHENFKLKSLAQSHGLSTVSDWTKMIEEKREFNRVACLYGLENPEVYLRDCISLDIWGEAEAIYSQSREKDYNDHRSESYIIAKRLVTLLSANSNRHVALIADLLPRLVELNQFDLHMQAILRRRWTYIDSILEGWLGKYRTVRCDVPRWQEISQLFKSTTAKEENELPARLNQISSALWLSLLVFLVTVPTTALGWQHSPHQRGTTQDADFWFLIQSSCMTILGFAALAIPIWRTQDFCVKARVWVWGLLIAASLCVALSPLVYIFGPTEWSQFMSIVSGIIQVFLTLQIALIADNVGKGGGKRGKDR